MNEIFKRVSIRKYEDKPVEQEKIEKILRAAMAAPSAGNQQPWEFYVVTDKKRSRHFQSAALMPDAQQLLLLSWFPAIAQKDLHSPVLSRWIWQMQQRMHFLR